MPLRKKKNQDRWLVLIVLLSMVPLFQNMSHFDPEESLQNSGRDRARIPRERRIFKNAVESNDLRRDLQLSLKKSSPNPTSPLRPNLLNSRSKYSPKSSDDENRNEVIGAPMRSGRDSISQIHRESLANE